MSSARGVTKAIFMSPSLNQSEVLRHLQFLAWVRRSRGPISQVVASHLMTAGLQAKNPGLPYSTTQGLTVSHRASDGMFVSNERRRRIPLDEPHSSPWRLPSCRRRPAAVYARECRVAPEHRPTL